MATSLTLLFDLIFSCCWLELDCLILGRVWEGNGEFTCRPSMDSPGGCLGDQSILDPDPLTGPDNEAGLAGRVVERPVVGQVVADTAWGLSLYCCSPVIDDRVAYRIDVFDVYVDNVSPVVEDRKLVLGLVSSGIDVGNLVDAVTRLMETSCLDWSIHCYPKDHHNN